MDARNEFTGETIVYVVDDDASIRQALDDLLSAVGQKVRCFADAESFIVAPKENCPACLILDIRMPGLSGMDFHRRMAGLGLDYPVVFITGHGDIAMGVEAMKNGAIEFLTKPFRDLDLLDAIQRGLAIGEASQQKRAEGEALLRRWRSLNTGEKQVARLVVTGLLNKQTAGILGVSEITVKVRRAQIMRKMEAGSLPDLVREMDRLRGLSPADLES